MSDELVQLTEVCADLFVENKRLRDELLAVKRTKWMPPAPGETIAVPKDWQLGWTDHNGTEWSICRKAIEERE